MPLDQKLARFSKNQVFNSWHYPSYQCNWTTYQHFSQNCRRLELV